MAQRERIQSFVGSSKIGPTKIGICLVLVGWLGMTTAVACGAVSKEDEARIGAITSSLKSAGKDFAAKRYDASAETVREVQRQFEMILSRADAELLDKLRPLYRSLQTAHGLLTQRGFALDALPPWPNDAKSPAKTQADITTTATDSEKVRFAVELASVLAEQCGDCHGAARAQSGFRVANFKALLAGGDSGSAIVAGKGSESLLIQKLRGTADGQRMPLNRPALPDELIAKFEAWVDQGATLDVESPTVSLAELANVARAGDSTAEELSQQRAEISSAHWRLAMPGVMPQQVTTDHFLLVGRMAESRLHTLGQAAERELTAIAAQLRVSPNAVFKGRATLFVFDRRYDLSEFGRMVEKREIAAQQPAIWKHESVDIYAALSVTSETADAEIDLLMCEQIAALAIAELPGTPHWFADGAARVIAARLHRSAPRVRTWDSEASEALGLVHTPSDFLDGDRVGPEMHAARYAFTKSLATQSRSFHYLLSQLREGREFAGAFQTAYKKSLDDAAAAWVGGRRG